MNGEQVDLRALARLVTQVEDDRAPAHAARAAIMAGLADRRRAPIVGVTGAPGAGKSSLLGAVIATLRARRDADDHPTVAVIAVDPSSPRSGGALLGDRMRMQLSAADAGVYLRSQASNGALGGLAPATYPVARLLRRLFDLVIIETVGVGQSEIDVARVADATVLVLPPNAGDHVQHLKAGIMEVPDLYVISKCDVDRGASRAQLGAALAMTPGRGGVAPRIIPTSARTGEGIAAVADALLAVPVQADAARDRWFLERWVRDALGKRGVDELARAGGAASALARAHGDLDHALADLACAMV